MGAPAFKFFKDGLLRVWSFADLLRRDNDYNVIDSEGEVFVPRVPYGTTDLDLAEKIWMKEVDDVIWVYYGTTLMYKFDAISGNLVYGFSDFNTLSLTKGGTGYEAIGADDTERLTDLLTNYFGLGSAAYKNAGTSANNVLVLSENNKLPAIDGSLLTGITNIAAGTIMYTAGLEPLPGTLKANGALVSRSLYPSLFSAISTVYGAGDGVTTFQLPDARGEFIRGWDDGRGIDSGRALGSLQLDAFQGHKHLPPDGANTYHGDGSGNGRPTGAGTNCIAPRTGVPTTDGTNGTPRTANETRPRNLAMLCCIKY